jgi:predicted RNA-binding Zn-ribbon protein involved in translation (DUF1610 family)
MRRQFERALLRLAAFTAVALFALLLVESLRSFYHSDTASIGIVTIVAHRGSLYVLPSVEWTLLDVESERVTGVPAWPIRQLSFPLRTWNDETVLGFNGWTGGGGSVFMLLKCPIWFPLLLSALLAVCCHRRGAEILPRTYYLQCPTCGYLLSGVVHWRCPECGHQTLSRVVEAVPSRPHSSPQASAHLQINGVRAPHVTRDHVAGQV